MSQVRYGQSGYCGASKSRRAVAAERDGKYPLTTAAQLVAEQAQCSGAHARKCLERIGACEWHHVGKYAAECEYYEVGELAVRFARITFPRRQRAALLRRWTREAFQAAREASEARELRTASLERHARIVAARPSLGELAERRAEIEAHAIGVRIAQEAQLAALLRKPQTPGRAAEIAHLRKLVAA